MVELVIASGKGGTGKTSLVGSFAALAKSAVLIDCDVDAANLNLIINHKVLEKHDFSSSSKASINKSKCTACGICKDKCRFDAISCKPIPSPVPYYINPLLCEGCGLCKQVCAENAIVFNQVKSGEWFESESDYGPFLHARLGIAQANSGKLVSLLRKQARDMAEKSNIDLILIDGPPGIGCPAIASITGASYLVIITEPSLSAIHDMKRLAELAGQFKIGMGLCVNKYDINIELTEQIERYAESAGIQHHGRIPFDMKFNKAQLEGKPYTLVASKSGSGVIAGIWRSIGNRIKLIKNESLKNKIETDLV